MSTQRPKRAALYIRQSQYHDGSISEELQVSTCRAFAESRGWEVVGEPYADIDLSGRSTEKREGLKALRAAYDRGEFDIAIAHAYSRFARNMADGAEIVAEMPLATVLEGEAPEDDDFMPLLHLLLAHKQSKEIGKRWKEVHAYRLGKGLPPNGGKRFGYIYNKEDGTYTQDPVTAPVLREMYHRFISGHGMPSITSWLNESGIKTTGGRAFSERTTREIMNAGFGAGYFEFGGTEFKGSWEPVISEDVWEQYKRARAARSIKHPKNQNVRWHLQGIVKCWRCGANMIKNGEGKIACSTRVRRGAAVCEGIWERQAWIDKKIALWLGGHIDEWAKATPVDVEKRAKAEARSARAQEALDAAEVSLGRLAKGWASGLLDDTGYLKARASVEAEQAQARAEKDAAQAELDTLLPAEADPHAIIEAAGDDVGQFNAVLSKIINRIEAHPGNRLLVVDSHGQEVWLSKKK